MGLRGYQCNASPALRHIGDSPSRWLRVVGSARSSYALADRIPSRDAGGPAARDLRSPHDACPAVVVGAHLGHVFAAGHVCLQLAHHTAAGSEYFRGIFRIAGERPRGAGAFRAGLGYRRRPVRPGNGTPWHGPGLSHHHGAHRQPGRADSAARVLPANSSDNQRLGVARRDRAGDLRHRIVLHCRFAQNTFRQPSHRRRRRTHSRSAWPSRSWPAYSRASPMWGWHSVET